jgi:hypothetical protein
MQAASFYPAGCWPNDGDGIEDPAIGIYRAILDAGKYAPCLFDAWFQWRLSYQLYYSGVSVFSDIPNTLYNEMREKVFKTILQHIKSNPDDETSVFACVKLITETNIVRFGSPMGNSMLGEMVMHDK